MNYILHDADLYETVVDSRPCTNCGGDLGPCRGRCNGQASLGQRLRSPDEVAKIKAARRRADEDKILAEAELIKTRRGIG